MERIMVLLDCYKQNDSWFVEQIVGSLRSVMKAGSNNEAEESARSALSNIKKIVPHYHEHVQLLESFIKDLKPKVKVSPLM